MDSPATNTDRSSPVLVTGATGMVGGAVVEQLRAAGRRVRALVRPASDTRFITALGAELVPGDLTDPTGLRSACRGCVAVVHTAARVELAGPPRLFRRDNADATRWLAAAASDCGVKRFVHVSSVAVHGAPNGRVVRETTPFPPLPRFAAYATSKRVAERAVRDASRRGGMEHVILRLGFVYGPRNRMMHHFLRPLLKKKTFMVPDGGRRRFAPIYVDDAARAIVLSVDHPAAANETFLLVGPELVEQREYFQAYAEGFGLEPPRRSVPAALAFLSGWAVEGLGLIQGRQLRINRALVATCLMPEHFSGEKIERRLGWSPEIRMCEGLRRTFAWYDRQYANAIASS